MRNISLEWKSKGYSSQSLPLLIDEVDGDEN